MPIYAPKILFFGGLEPLNVISHHRDPQKAHPWQKPHNFVGADWSTGATWAAEGIKNRKKEKKARKETQTTHVDAAIRGLACRVVFGR